MKNPKNMVSFLSIVALLLVSTISVEGKAKGVNCNPGNPGVINLQEFIIAPNDPIYIGDVATLGLAVELSEDLVQPIQTSVTLKKKIGPFYIKGPCVEGVGSCDYPDWCDVCATCKCPLGKGRHQFSLPFNVTSSDLRGTYQANIFFTSATGQTGCVDITNISIQ